MLRISRTNSGLIGEWWFTVDRLFLFGVIFLGMIGLYFSLAISPVEADDLNTDKYYFLMRQTIYLFVSLSLMFLVSILSESFTRKLSLIMFFFGILGLLLTLFIGVNSGGSSRWLSLWGYTTVQPSEFLKPAFVVLSAWFYTRAKIEKDKMLWWLPIILFLIISLLLLSQPDLGQTILLFLTLLGVIFLQGLSWTIIAPIFVLGLFSFVIFYLNFSHFALRVDSWLEIWFGSGKVDSKLTQTQAAIDAIENGKIFGKGIGESWVKYDLPDAYTDFIFAAIAEENGLIVTLPIMILYCALVFRGFSKVLIQHNYFKQLASAGLLLLFGLQTLIHIAVNLSLVPAKGMTLPFISYGGSSMVSMGITMGMFLAITRKTSPSIGKSKDLIKYETMV